MNTTTFINTHHTCPDGQEFALRYATMSEVWEHCQRPDWLLYILSKQAPINNRQALTLAIAIVEDLLQEDPEYVTTPSEAIETAKRVLNNPSEQNQDKAHEIALQTSKYMYQQKPMTSKEWVTRSLGASVIWMATCKLEDFNNNTEIIWTIEKANSLSTKRSRPQMNKAHSQLVKQCIANPFN